MSRTKKKTKATKHGQISLSAATYARLKAEAKARGVSMSSLVEAAVRPVLSSEERAS